MALVSSAGSDFNFDFGVSVYGEAAREGGEYNFKSFPSMQPMLEANAGPIAEQAVATGTDPAGYLSEGPGMSALRSRTGSSTTRTRPMRAASMS